jgi:hypothetical protein
MKYLIGGGISFPLLLIRSDSRCIIREYGFEVMGQ